MSIGADSRSPLRTALRAIRLLALGAAAAAGLLVAHWRAWALIPPIPARSLAKRGRFVTVQGIDTYCETYGSGPPLILIPAGGSHTSTWRRNIGPLSQRYQVWTLDLPGSGYTEKPPTFAYTHEAYAAFVRDFMRAVGIGRAVVAGHSLGGTVALELSLDYPEQTAGLILLASGGYPQADTPGLIAINRYEIPSAIVMSFSSYPLVVRSFLRDLYDDPAPFQSDAELIRELCDINRTENIRSAWYWMPRALRWSFGLPDPGRIRSVAAPTLIVWGDSDKITPIDMARRFAQDIRGSSLVVVERAGHMVHEERPDAVNRAVLDFLGGLTW